MPESGIFHKAPAEILTFEEITTIVRLATSIGIDKVKITGGEPLVRRDLPKLLELLLLIPGLRDLSVTTNGTLLQRYADDLRAAGLRRINVSIDTLNKQKFTWITKLGNLNDVIKGIDAALQKDFFVKLNVVVMRGVNDDELLDFAKFAGQRNIILRFIELMPMMHNRRSNRKFFISCDEIKDRLSQLGSLNPIDASFGNGPARYYEIPEAFLIVGFITPISCKFCFGCNRLRLTSTGLLMSCLGSDIGLDLKGPLRENRQGKVLELIKQAASLKPLEHNFGFLSTAPHLMSQIGG